MDFNCTEVILETYGKPVKMETYAIRKWMGVVLFPVLSLHALGPLVLMIQRRNLFPVCVHSVSLVAVQTMGVVCLHLIVFPADIMEHNGYPCDMLMICRLLFVPLLAAPQLVMLSQMYNRNQLANAMTNFKITDESLNLDGLMRKVRKAGKMNELKVLAFTMIGPGLMIVYTAATGKEYFRGCVDCGRDIRVEIFYLGYAVFVAVPALYILRQMRHIDDPLQLRHQAARVLKIFVLVGMLYIGAAAADPGGIGKKGYWNHAYFLMFSSHYALHVNCFRPVRETFRDPKAAYRFRRQPKKNLQQQSASSKHAVSPSVAASTAASNIKLGLRGVLSSPEGILAFQKHLASEYNVENILFWKSATEWRDMYHDAPTEQARTSVARNIFVSFVPQDAKMQINLRDSQRVNVEEAFGKGEDGLDKPIDRDVFDEAIEEIFNLMKRDGFQRFKNTEEYKHLCENVLTHLPSCSVAEEEDE